MAGTARHAVEVPIMTDFTGILISGLLPLSQALLSGSTLRCAKLEMRC